MTIDPDAHRAQSLETWGRMAPGWEERNEWLNKNAGPVNEWIVERVAPEPGQTVLDLAAGPGDLGFRAAARVGDEGRVISTDLAPEMVEVARRLGSSRGLTNLEYRQMNAEEMPLDDDSVDAVVCRWGYMLMADPARALAETRRVLRQGGALGFAVFGSPDRNPWAGVPAATLVERGDMQPPEAGRPGIFAMADPGRVRELVAGAGFGEPELEEISFEWRYADYDDLWDTNVRLAGALAEVIIALPPEEQQTVREAVMERMAPYRNQDGTYTTPAVCIGALAR